MPGVPVAGNAVQSQPRQPFEKDAKSGLHFEAGERSADTVVDSRTEADVWIRAAQGHEVGRGGKLGFVAVGGREEESDLVAFFQRDTSVFEIFQRVALKHVQRGVEAEHFLAASRRVGKEVGG